MSRARTRPNSRTRIKPSDEPARTAGRQRRRRPGRLGHCGAWRIGRVVVSRCVSGSEQYRLTVERSTDGFGGDTAATEDDDPISHPDDLLRIVANQNNRDPLGRQVGDDAMDFRLCPDVNTSRRFVKNEDSRRWNQPFRQEHLLLVSAGEGVRQLLDSRCDDPHPGCEVPGDLRLLRTIDDAKSIGEVPEDRERFVRANRKLKHQPLLMAVFGQERDSEPHRLPRRTRTDNPAVAPGSRPDRAA